MSDQIGQGGGLESSVDTGNVNPGEMAGGEVWGQGGTGSGAPIAGMKGGLFDEEEMEDQRDEAVEQAEEAGVSRPTYNSMEEVHQARAEEQARMDAEDEAWEAYVAEQERLEAEKDAARDEAHANEQAFLEEEYVEDGQTYQTYSLPDGTMITVNEDGDAVSVQWPEGEGPEYIGVVYIGGEPHTVWRLPTGEDIVVDADNNTLGTLDEVDLDETTVDLFILTDDPDDIGTPVTIELVPGDDYSTEVRDAETGEVYDTWEAPDDVLGGEIALASASGDGDIGVDMAETYSLYNPPGTDYYVVVDANGVPVDTIPIPEEPEWSILGIVEYYEGGEIVVDLGNAEISVDVVGPDGGITVDLDMLIVEGTAGVEWNEDGSWNFDVDVDVDAGAFELGVDMGFGQDAAGMAFFDLETSMSMQLGFAKFEGGQDFHFQQTPDGSEWNVGMHGSLSAFGAYIARDQDLTVVFDDDGMTTTYQDSIEGGVKGLGGFKVTNETQFQTDGTLDGTSASQGGYVAVVDKDGDDVIGGGAGFDTEDGWYTRSERIDTGADYERQYGNDLPDALDTSDAGVMGEGAVHRYGLGGRDADESDDGDASRGIGIGERRAAGQEGEEIAGRMGMTRDRYARTDRNEGDDDGPGRLLDPFERPDGESRHNRDGVDVGGPDGDGVVMSGGSTMLSDHLADDIASPSVVMSGGSTMATGGDVSIDPASGPQSVDGSIPMQAADREQAEGGVDVATGGPGRSEGALDLTDDIAPVAPAAAATTVDPPAEVPDAGADEAAFRPEVGDEVIVEVAQVETAVPVVEAPAAEPEPVFVQEDPSGYQAMPELDAAAEPVPVDTQVDDLSVDGG